MEKEDNATEINLQLFPQKQSWWKVRGIWTLGQLPVLLSPSLPLAHPKAPKVRQFSRKALEFDPVHSLLQNLPQLQSPNLLQSDPVHNGGKQVIMSTCQIKIK
jgi:hypothetical protein